MPVGILGKKLGMTRLFDESGKQVPVTVIEAGPCHVSQVKTAESDGYDAVQLAYEQIKARSSTMPVIGHDGKAGLTPQRHHREIRVTADEAAGFELGQQVTVEALEGIKFVDVIGTTKGKGTAGTMKRWGFKGMSASHGTERKHRHPGSVGGRSSNAGTGRPKKGGKKAGRMGHTRVTVRSLEVIATDKDKNLVMVKGSVPGANQGLLLIREAVRLFKSKGKAD